jgi:NAD(P)H-dependent flavin oxidoreductase YrpB (nitropropane dioxygenase family)
MANGDVARLVRARGSFLGARLPVMQAPIGSATTIELVAAVALIEAVDTVASWSAS